MAARSRGIQRWLAGVMLLLALGLLLWWSQQPPAPSRRHATATQGAVRRELPVSRPTPLSGPREVPSFPAEAPQVQVGLLLKNIYNLQRDSQTFSADGWYWLEWGEDVQAILRAHGLTPTQMVEFSNQVDAWDSLIEPENADPQSIPDGRHYQLFRFSARFYIDSVDERHFPFEMVVLPVVLETRPESFALSQSAVRLRAAPELGSLTGDYSELAGYSLKRNWVVEGQNLYDLIGSNRDELYSQVSFRVAYGSEPWAAFMKWILPLLIVMSIVLLAPSLESSLDDMRLAIPSTALLTLVFLQQAYKADLPATPYLTFLDKLYAASYLVAVGLFALFLADSNRLEEVAPEQRDQVRTRINRIDRRCQRGALLGLAIVAVLAWFF